MVNYIMSDVVDEIKEREDNPANCGYDRFVGLEHYVSGEVEIRQYGPTNMLGSSMKVFHAGDILVARRNVYLRRAGIVNFDGITSGDSIVLRARDERIGRLLPFVLNSTSFWDYADKYSDGTMSKRLSPKLLMKYEFNLPGEDQQDYYADLLWAATETKVAYQDMIRSVDELVKSQFIEIFGDPGKNPKGWPESTLKDICVGKLSYGSGAAATDYDGETRYVRITDITDEGELNDDIKSPSTIDDKYLLKDGDILFARSGATVGKVLRYKEQFGRSIYAGFLIRLVPDTEIVLPDYVFGFTRTPFYEEFVRKTQRAVGQPNINAQEYGDLKICIPPMELQNQFTEFLRQSDKSKFELQEAIKSIDDLIRSIIQQDLS